MKALYGSWRQYIFSTSIISGKFTDAPVDSDEVSHREYMGPSSDFNMKDNKPTAITPLQI